LTVASPSLRITNHPCKGVVMEMWPIFNFGGPHHISGVAEATGVKFCAQVGYVKS